MSRLITCCLSSFLLLSAASQVRAQPDLSGPPVTYEVMINGESFRVEGNRVVKLQSKEKPGTSYEIAIRVAPTQRLRLNTVELDYELPARITDDRGRAQRTVTVKHELGFSMLITDLGEPLDAKAQDEALKILTDSVAESYREQKVAELEVGKPYDVKLENGSARTAKIHYQDDKGYGHTCLALVVGAEKSTVTCVAQYLDEDAKEVAPLVKKTLNSIRPLP